PPARFPPLEAFGRRPPNKRRCPSSGRHPKPFTTPDVASTDTDGSSGAKSGLHKTGLVAAELPGPRVHAAALGRAERTDEARDPDARDKNIRIRLVESARCLLRTPAQCRFVDRQELAVPKSAPP